MDVLIVLMVEKEVRDEGVTLVERWLASKHELSELELLKAWKALFFCTPSFLSPAHSCFPPFSSQ